MRKLMLSVLLTLVCFSFAGAYDAESTCVQCHGNKIAMEKLGYGQLYLDPAEVDKEVNMGEVACVDCHLGDNTQIVAVKAHEGMPRPFYAAVGKNYKYQAVGREITHFDPIQPKGKVNFKYLMRKPDEAMAKEKGITAIMQLYYHDHNPATMAYSPEIAEKTCGKCHEEEVKEYNVSGMGLNKYQRGFTSFSAEKPGPQNCGAWFGDNHDKISAELATEYPKGHAAGSDRGCNKCHASCSDCHYKGFEASKGRHVFSKEVKPLSCYGSGKGTICHAGPMDRRRGAGYMRGAFAFPAGELPQDVHQANGVTCNDCHTMENHSYGHLNSDSAKQSCKNCHEDIYEAVKTSDHGDVDCTSCHIQAVGAYQFTFWGPGKQEAQVKVLTKHKEFYGTRSEPTLVKHPESGLWIPLKPYPMGVMNIKHDVKPTGLLLREIEKTTVKGNTKIGEPESFVVERTPDQVNDMYIINGTFGKLAKNSKMLAWIQMDKMSHAINKGRDCESCHSSHDQVASSWYTYDNSADTKKPFNGSYTIKGTKDGLFFTDWKTETPEPVDGRSVEDFAPYLKTGNVWDVKGIDFSIPFDDAKYASARGKYSLVYAKIHQMKQQYKGDKEKLEKVELAKKILPHNAKKAAEILDGI
jgi:hypothetical protein